MKWLALMLFMRQLPQLTASTEGEGDTLDMATMLSGIWELDESVSFECTRASFAYSSVSLDLGPSTNFVFLEQVASDPRARPSKGTFSPLATVPGGTGTLTATQRGWRNGFCSMRTYFDAEAGTEGMFGWRGTVRYVLTNCGCTSSASKLDSTFNVSSANRTWFPSLAPTTAPTPRPGGAVPPRVAEEVMGDWLLEAPGASYSCFGGIVELEARAFALYTGNASVVNGASGASPRNWPDIGAIAPSLPELLGRYDEADDSFSAEATTRVLQCEVTLTLRGRVAWADPAAPNATTTWDGSFNAQFEGQCGGCEAYSQPIRGLPAPPPRTPAPSPAPSPAPEEKEEEEGVFSMSAIQWVLGVLLVAAAACVAVVVCFVCPCRAKAKPQQSQGS